MGATMVVTKMVEHGQFQVVDVLGQTEGPNLHNSA